jgi:hypothetical protein
LLKAHEDLLFQGTSINPVKFYGIDVGEPKKDGALPAKDILRLNSKGFALLSVSWISRFARCAFRRLIHGHLARLRAIRGRLIAFAIQRHRKVKKREEIFQFASQPK